jgi:hypothetical protein
VTDKGFEGQDSHRRWQQGYGATVICPPKRNSKLPWPKRWRRWLAGIRQIIETAYDKLLHALRLDRERPHTLEGFQARLAAKMALHNFCIWFNEQLGRPRLNPIKEKIVDFLPPLPDKVFARSGFEKDRVCASIFCILLSSRR